MPQNSPVAATALMAISDAMRNVTNNLANYNTTAYKSSELEFADLTYQSSQRLGITATDGVPNMIQLGRGVTVSSITKNFVQGPLNKSENPYSIAINGIGFISVILPDGRIAYTRNGALSRNNLGRIVACDKYELEAQIEVPLEIEDFTIAQDGEVSVKLPNQQEPQPIGRILLTRFINPAGLEAIGDNLYLPTDASGDPQEGTATQDNYGEIRQYFLEGSNVNSIKALLDMLDLQQVHSMVLNCLNGGYQAEKGLIEIKV
ncbi:MAG: flagellar hook-basal body complex protein [Candidatus Lariskella arthropodorum]|uniref:flagellar hook-basal body complex protein n=1 Tax=Candidatus Lariskella endosymbiont of Epinotia ramella TaxID=3066224 RepID=UPI0030D3815A